MSLNLSEPSIVAQPAGALSEVVDYRPILTRNTENAWSRVGVDCDKLYNRFSKVVREEGLDVLVLRSAPVEYPAWVQVAAWVPQRDRNCARRAWLKVSIEPKPYHEHEIEYSVQCSSGRGSRTWLRVQPFDSDGARALVRYILGRGPKPSLPRFRSGLDFWRPSNKFKAIGTDLLGFSALTLMIAGAIAMGVPIEGGWLRLAGFVTLLVGVLFLVRVMRRPYIVRTQGKPLSEPRRLGRVDSWQTVIFGAGGHASELRRRFESAIETPPTDKFSHVVEKVWHWGLDGKEEREQFVLSTGRGIVFCQIYQYGNDLYVGWDGHVNFGQWTEKTIASGIDRELRLPVAVSVIEPGFQLVSEYDLIDLSCLMEWTHVQLTTLAKRLMEELKIDQEIDFTILRGTRQGLTEGNAAEEKAQKKEAHRTFSFRRTG